MAIVVAVKTNGACTNERPIPTNHASTLVAKANQKSAPPKIRFEKSCSSSL